MSLFIAETLGTAMLIILGQGVVANVVLEKTKGNNGGLIAIAFGWCVAVFVGVYIANAIAGGAHLNPAITITFAYMGKINWADVPAYIGGQFAGAMLGALIIWLAYKQHFDATTNADSKLGVFCTAPSIRNSGYNLIAEIIGTFVLLIGVLFLTKGDNKLGSLDALPVALLILGIGLGLGGPTGYAINPARDLGPRIMHAILPIKNKRNSDWGYSWIPVIGPVIGGLAAGLLYQWLGK
jgi:glycerol uptake facilitator protein